MLKILIQDNEQMIAWVIKISGPIKVFSWMLAAAWFKSTYTLWKKVEYIMYSTKSINTNFVFDRKFHTFQV